MAREKFLDDAQPGEGRKEARSLQDQRCRVTEFKIGMVKAAGGVFDVEQVRVLLELPSVEAVYSAVRQRRLLAVEDNDRLCFPSSQFAGGQVLPGIQAILMAIPETNGWRILQYLYGRGDGLAGDRPIDLVNGSTTNSNLPMRSATSSTPLQIKRGRLKRDLLRSPVMPGRRPETRRQLC